MTAHGGDSVRFLPFAVASTSALDMVIAVVGFASGYYGIDCSIPTASVLQKWPAWLRPSIAEVAHNSPNVEIVVTKKRPLIYVYDLPPEFNSHLLEGRHYRMECVNRIYSGDNKTIWTEHLYGAQVLF